MTAESQVESVISEEGVEDADSKPSEVVSVPSEAKVIAASLKVIDCQRTCLQHRFFDHFAFDQTSDLLAAVDAIQVDLPTLIRSRDAREYVYSGWIYWFLFLKGCLQYQRSGVIDRANLYFCYFVDYYLPQRCDPSLSSRLLTDERAAERVERRFTDFAKFQATAGSDYLACAPVRIVLPEPDGNGTLKIVGTDGETIEAFRVDGWHRLFGAHLFQIRCLDAEFLETDLLSDTTS